MIKNKQQKNPPPPRP